MTGNAGNTGNVLIPTAPLISWSRFAPAGETSYEVSSAGDKRFSALYAKLNDGRTIEEWYQCDIKGYEPGGRNWRLGKGKPSIRGFPGEGLYTMYLSLWRLWALRHPDLMMELDSLVHQHGDRLTDRFASTPINQARALSQILNEWSRELTY